MIPCLFVLVFVVICLSPSIFVQPFVRDFRVVKIFLEFHVLLVQKFLVEVATVATIVVISLKNRVPDRSRDRVLAVELALYWNRRRRADAVCFLDRPRGPDIQQLRLCYYLVGAQQNAFY